MSVPIPSVSVTYARDGSSTRPNEMGMRPMRELDIDLIERFVEEHGRLPQHGESRDIFERLYAVRLDRLRALAECRAVLKGRDPSVRRVVRAKEAAQLTFGIAK